MGGEQGGRQPRVAAATSGAIAALILGGCSLEPEAPEEIPPPPATKEGSNQGKVGDAIRLSGGDVEMPIDVRVRLVRVIDPLPAGSSDQVNGPKRFVGVELELENVGTVAYDEAPLGASTMTTSDGAEASRASVTSGLCAQRFPSNLRVPPGQKRETCATFELDPRQRPASFEFALDSGFGSEVAEWML